MLRLPRISVGTDLPSVLGVRRAYPMTLVLALEGTNEVVIAADTMAHDGDNEGLYKFELHKLRKMGNGWVFSSAGTQIGFDLFDAIHQEGRTFNANINVGVHEFAARMRKLYDERGYTGPAFVILAGAYDASPSIYTWSLERDQSGNVRFDGATRAYLRTAIGANHHGAMYFANAFHSQALPTNERILLAYLSVSEATKHDPRVGGTVEIAIVTQLGVRFLGQEERSQLEQQAQETMAALAAQLKAAANRVTFL